MYRRTHQSFTLMTKLTCMILSLLLIVCAVPTIPVWAEDTATVVQESTVTEATATSNPEVEPAAPTTGNAILSAEGVLDTDAIPATVTEVTSLREESIKHFKLPDGTYRAVIYADAVHRKDAAGQWQNIDNRLYLSQDSKSNTEAYRTTDGRTSFAKSYTANEEIFSITEDGYAVSVSMISNQLTLEPIVGGELVTQATGTTAIAETSTVTVTNAPAKANPRATEWASIEAALESVGGDDGSITYTNVTSNTDLEYVLQGNVIRGKIVVNSRALSYVYRLKLDIEGLTPILTNSGSVSLCDADNIERLVIPAPYMYDANGTISYDVTYGLTTNADGTYTLTVTADSAWINNISRILPVTIDVTLTTPEEHIDTYVAKDQPEKNFEDLEILIAGYGSSSNYEYVTLIRMPYINTIIPPTYEITSASLSMTYSIVAGGSVVVLDCHQITSEWNASEIKWSDYADGLDYATASSGTTSLSGSFTNTTFDLTTLAQGWHEERYPNYGFLLKANSLSSQCPAYFTTASAPPEAAAYYPVVTIEYAPTIRDGVYALKNVGNSNMWMSVADNSILPSASVIQRELTTSPVTSFDRGALFKISHIAGTDEYVIRCMTNNRMSLQLVDGQVKTVAISDDDASVPTASRFRFCEQSDGTFVIEFSLLNQLYVTAPDMSVGENQDVNRNLTASYGTINDFTKWTLTCYNGSQHLGGMDLVKPLAWSIDGGIDVSGSGGTAMCTAWSTVIGVNKPYISAHTSDVATVTWDDSAKMMSYTPHNIGVVNLLGHVKNSSGTIYHTVSLQLPVIPSESLYYLQNVSSGRYAALEELSSAVGVAIEESLFLSENHHRWLIEHAPYENGYVRIKSVYSGLYIGNNHLSPYVNQYYGITDETLWRFERTPSGNIKLVNKANGMVISSDGTAYDGSNLIVATYTNNQSYGDEWQMIKKRLFAVNYYDSSFANNALAIAKIGPANEFVNQVYKKYFGVEILMDGSPSSHASTADTCPTGTHEPCSSESCGSVCRTSHHKNLGIIADQLYYADREDDHVYIMWTDRNDRTYCLEENSTHKTLALVYGATYDFRPVIHFLNYVSSYEEIMQAFTSLIIAHEMAHVMQMADVYNNPGHDISGGTACIMEAIEHDGLTDFYEAVKDGYAEAFCESCMEALREYTSAVNIIGN